jgi:hypothetical protein
MFNFYVFEDSMKIYLDLEKHCIETEIKRRHEAAMSHYFKQRGDKQAIESELVLLEEALAAFDFPFLRGRWPVLSGGHESNVFLTYDASGKPCLQFENHSIVAS